MPKHHSSTTSPNPATRVFPRRRCLWLCLASTLGLLLVASCFSPWVTIHRDVYGVPHIYAPTEEGVMFGFGYAQAEDRLEPMLHNLLAAAGRLAEFRGAGAGNAYLDSDRKMRLYRIPQIAEALYPSLADQTRQDLERFAEGIARYLDDHPGEIAWARDYRPSAQDVFALTRRETLLNQMALVAQKVAQYDAGACPSNLAGGGASNSWAVGPSLTDTGGVVVQIDPHLPWNDDGLTVGAYNWYEAHLEGGGLRVAGSAILGTPFLRLGHTASIAWAGTANHPDNTDVYEIQGRTDPDRPGEFEYLYDGAWLDIPHEQASILVLVSPPGQDPPQFTTDLHDLYSTHHGPLVFQDPLDSTRAFAARLPSFHEPGILETSLAINRATSVAEAMTAVQTLQIPNGNAMIGDSTGAIRWVSLSRHPRRPAAVSCWTRPIDGTTSATEWGADDPQGRELLEFSELAQLQDPAADFLTNNNVQPWYVTSNLSESDFSWYPGLFKPGAKEGYRGRLARQTFEEKIAQAGTFSVAELEALSFSDYVLSAESFLPILDQALQDLAPTLTPDEARVRDILLIDWPTEGQTMHVDSLGPLLYTQWWNRLIAKASLPSLDPPDPTSLTQAQVQDAVDALVETADYLLQSFGSVEVPWGDVHTLERAGELDDPGRMPPIPRPMHGGGKDLQTLFMATASTNAPDYGIGNAAAGSSYMMRVHLLPGGGVEAVSIKPYGQSQDPASPHYADLTDLFSQKLYKPAWFELDDVLANLESTLTLGY